MTDLVEYLRIEACFVRAPEEQEQFAKAADEIESLRATVARVKKWREEQGEKESGRRADRLFTTFDAALREPEDAGKSVLRDSVSQALNDITRDGFTAARELARLRETVARRRDGRQL